MSGFYLVYGFTGFVVMAITKKCSFLNMCQTRPLFVYLRFSQYNDKFSTNIDYIKAEMVCLGFDPETVGADESIAIKEMYLFTSVTR